MNLEEAAAMHALRQGIYRTEATAMTDHPSKHVVKRVVLFCFVLATAGVCTPAADASDPAGCWSGRWVNCHDIFKGSVKAKITKCDASHYHATFRGICFKVVPYRYTVKLSVTGVENGTVHLRGQEDLGIWGGYVMDASVTGSKFTAKYEKCDGSGYGYFTMCRE